MIKPSGMSLKSLPTFTLYAEDYNVDVTQTKIFQTLLKVVSSLRYGTGINLDAIKITRYREGIECRRTDKFFGGNLGMYQNPENAAACAIRELKK